MLDIISHVCTRRNDNALGSFLFAGNNDDNDHNDDDDADDDRGDDHN